MKVGNKIKTERANWSFGKETANNFEEHVQKSVPYYDDGHDLVCYLSDFFCSSNSICYELGTSTGTLLRKLSTYNKHKPEIKWIGIDREKEMIKKARNHCKGIKNISLRCDDILLFEYERSDFIIAYYTMQFVKPSHRQDLFNRIYETLNWGGAFLFFEKVRGSDARFQDIMTSLYNDFKLRNGFSSEEILNKTQSLKGVLEPFSTQGNLDLLKRAGFTDIITVMKYVCFEGFLAIK